MPTVKSVKQRRIEGQIYRDLDVNETPAQIGVAGEIINLKSIVLDNLAAADVFVKFYDTVAAPTVGTTTPALTIPVQASGDKQIHTSGENSGFTFQNGCWIAAVTGVADDDTTGAGTNELIANIVYK